MITAGMVLALALAGQAAEAALAPAFNNTLVSTYGDGRTAKLWLNPDGSFTGQNRKGAPNAGKWTLARGRLCMKQYKPFYYPFSWCTPMPQASAAASGWAAKAPTGEPITVRLVKGR